MDEGKYLKVLNMLQARCSRSECCSRDMRTKALKALDGDEAVSYTHLTLPTTSRV